MDYISHLCEYKKNELFVEEAGLFVHKGEEHKLDHILPKEQGLKNLMISANEFSTYAKNGLFLKKTFESKPIRFSLHAYWYHLNSSQILTINYFYDFLQNKRKLNFLLGILEINEMAEEATFEYGLSDRTHVDFAIKLSNGKFVFFEVKYSEKSFGSLGENEGNNRIKEKKQSYPQVDISEANFRKYYQFVRNIVLGQDGNYTIFLYPKFNLSIKNNIENCIKVVENYSDFAVKVLLWEDLLTIIPNEQVSKKYFENVDSLR